jgi:4-amino-4-deoxy-L-arabinose transferase-like glycosyltransferase
MLAVFLLLHLALRLWATPNLSENDVQEAVAAQHWAWGYFPRNPPLYTWLVMGSYAVFGVTALAHVVVKYALLGALFAFAYLCGRLLLSTPTLAALSAWSLTPLSSLGWTVHTAFTHTLLLMVLVLGLLWAALRLTEKRRVLDYALVGAFIGLGFLAKYSFFLFLTPLTLAMISQRELRAALFDWRILLSIAIAGATFAPHGVWMNTARFDFARFLADTQHIDAQHSYLVDVELGLEDLFLASLTFLSPFVLIFAAIFWKSARNPAKPMTPWARATTLLPVISLVAFTLEVLVVRATHFELRYMACALLATPLVLFQWLDRRTVSERALMPYVFAVIVFAAVVLAGLAGRAVLDVRSCNHCREQMPFEALARDLRASGFTDGTILASDDDLGGNLRLSFPHARAIAYSYLVTQPAHPRNAQCVIVWNARRQGEALPEGLKNLMAALAIEPPASPPTHLEAPMLRSTTRMDRFAYWVLADHDGNCLPR